MAVVTEVFKGEFNISEQGVTHLTNALEKLLGLSDKVSKSLGSIKVTAPKILNGRNTKEDRRINQFSLENFGYDIDKLRSLLLKKAITPRIKSNKL